MDDAKATDSERDVVMEQPAIAPSSRAKLIYTEGSDGSESSEDGSIGSPLHSEDSLSDAETACEGEFDHPKADHPTDACPPAFRVDDAMDVDGDGGGECYFSTWVCGK